MYPTQAQKRLEWATPNPCAGCFARRYQPMYIKESRTDPKSRFASPLVRTARAAVGRRRHLAEAVMAKFALWFAGLQGLPLVRGQHAAQA